MAERQLDPNQRIASTLLFSGGTVRGSLKGETRTITGMNVNNSESVPVWVEIESEETKEAFSAVIKPGETLQIITKPLVQRWEPSHGGFWDGLNVRWKVPA